MASRARIANAAVAAIDQLVILIRLPWQPPILGTLVPNEDLSEATLVAGSVPARNADKRGFLLIGDGHQKSVPYAPLPGNNYHVSTNSPVPGPIFGAMRGGGLGVNFRFA